MNQLSNFLKNNKWLVTIFALFGLFVVSAFAGTAQLDALGEAGANAEAEAVNAIKSWKWLISLLPLGIAGFVTLKVKDHLEQKDEQGGGQTEPKWSRYLKLVATFVAMVIIVYVVLGVFAKVFANVDFGTAWQTFVVDFWSKIFQ